jgi:hypothetical protein
MLSGFTQEFHYYVLNSMKENNGRDFLELFSFR